MVSPFFSDSVLAGMRKMSDDTLVNSCAVYAAVNTPIPGGGNAITYPGPAAFTVPCRLSPLGATERVERALEDRVGNEKPVWIVSFARGTVIPPDARLVVTWTGADPWIKTLAVIGDAPKFDNEVYARVIAEEV